MGDPKTDNGTNGNGNGHATQPKPKKERSPNYPSINLKEAIAKAKLFHAQEKKQAAPIGVAVKHWGFSSFSGPARGMASALLKYGLLEEEGRGDDRRVKLSRLALNILLDEQPVSPERDTAIKEA